MADKHLSESEWIKFSKGKAFKDAALRKALVALDKAKAPADELEAATELNKQIVSLRRDAKNDKPALEYLANMGKAADKCQAAAEADVKAAAKQAEQAKQAERDKKEASEDDDPAILTTGLKSMLQQVQRGSTLFAMIVTDGGKVVGVMLSRRSIAPSKAKILKDYLGLSAAKPPMIGQCISEERAITFVVESKVTGLARKLVKALHKQTDARWKVRVRGDDPDDVDTDDDEDDSAPRESKAAVAEGEKGGTPNDASAKRYDVQIGIVALTQATLVDAVRALSAELVRLKGLLDVEMQAHGQRMQRGADDAWEAAARIASEALGRATMPPLEIWDPGYQALDDARRALGASQIDQAVEALRRTDAGLHAGRTAIASYDGKLEKGGDRSITALEGAKVAGAVAAGVATGGAAAAAEVGVLGSAAAAGTVGGAYGAAQELAGEGSAVYIADTKKQIDWAAVMRRGTTDAITGFVGGFIGGKLTERFCRVFGSYIGPLVSDAELLAMGQAQGLAGPLPRTAFMTATQKFAAEFLSSAALAPVQAAITQAINRISGGAPGPKNTEEFMEGVAKDIATGGVVQLLVAFLTHKMPPPPKSGGKPGGGASHEPATPAGAASAPQAEPVTTPHAPAKPAVAPHEPVPTGAPKTPPPGGAPARNEAPMAHIGEPTARPSESARKPRPTAAKPRPHGDLHDAALPPKTQGERPKRSRAELERAPAANDNVEMAANDNVEIIGDRNRQSEAMKLAAGAEDLTPSPQASGRKSGKSAEPKPGHRTLNQAERLRAAAQFEAAQKQLSGHEEFLSKNPKPNPPKDAPAKPRPPELEAALRELPKLEQPDERADAIRELLERPGWSDEARAYLQDLEKRAEAHSGKDAVEAVAKARDDTETSVGNAKDLLRQASMTVKKFLRRVGPNYKSRTSSRPYDEVMQKPKWEKLAERPPLNPDHIIPLDRIANSPEMTKLIEVYDRLKSQASKQQNLLAELQKIGDIDKNLASMREDANQHWKKDKLWSELSASEAARYGYDAVDFARALKMETEAFSAVRADIQRLITKYSN